MMTTEEDAQTAALQEYFDSDTPAGYGASFRAGWAAGRDWQRAQAALDAQGREARLREALERIAADWHRVECPETDICDCHEETARAALSAAQPATEAASD